MYSITLKKSTVIYNTVSMPYLNYHINSQSFNVLGTSLIKSYKFENKANKWLGIKLIIIIVRKYL